MEASFPIHPKEGGLYRANHTAWMAGNPSPGLQHQIRIAPHNIHWVKLDAAKQLDDFQHDLPAWECLRFQQVAMIEQELRACCFVRTTEGLGKPFFDMLPASD